MTNELEKQFFDTFGIEPEEEKYCLWECKEPSLEHVPCNKECKYQRHDIYYPQITDRILLGIIAKICWTYRCTQNDFDLYEVSTVEGLKEAVLKHAIELSKNDDYIYCEVQALFEEG